MHVLRCSALLAVGVVLAGCQAPEGEPPADIPPASETAQVAPVEEVFIPERSAQGSARENQPHIDFLITGALAGSTSRVEGRSLVELLVGEGYARDDMQLTADASRIELPADSVSLSVRIEDDCVIAQWGADWYSSSVEPTLAGGLCLLGETVSLD